MAFLLFQVALVWWCGNPCHSPCLLWVIWGVSICPSHPFVLHGSSLVLRKCKKELYVQTRTAVVNRPHFMGTQYGSVQNPYLIKMVSIHPGQRPRWLWVCNLSTVEENISCRWLSEQLQVVPGWGEWLEPQVRGCDLAPPLCTTNVTGTCGRNVSLTPLTNLLVNI